MMSGGSQGRSLELFFIDGRPDGMLTAEVFGWTGHVLVAPRTQISEALKRKEAKYTGVYILLGEIDGEPLAYIGEGDDVSDRIKNHDTKKDWWTTAVLVTSAANNLNKAYVRYLEARLIGEAQNANRITLENGTSPPLPPLTEAARANMEAFLANILLVLPAVRIDCFVKNTRPVAVPTEHGPAESGTPTFELNTPKHGVKAVAKLDNGEFVVQAGSLGRKSWVGPPTHNYAPLFEQLVRSGILVADGEHRRFAQSYAFKSPSAAAAVLNGRAANGQLEWKLQGQNVSYRQWEQAKLTSEGASGNGGT